MDVQTEPECGVLSTSTILDGVSDLPSIVDPEPVPDAAIGQSDVDLDQRGRERDRSQGGRPTLYTVPRVVTILAALYEGASRAEAAKQAGVGVSTFYVWLQLARAGHPTFAPLAEAVAKVEDSRKLYLFSKAVMGRKSFWNAFHC